MRAHLRVAISAHDVGRRVTVRYRIDGAPGEPRHSDAVGRLLSWEGGILCIRNRHGETVAVEESRLVAGRLVPEPPPRP